MVLLEFCFLFFPSAAISQKLLGRSLRNVAGTEGQKAPGVFSDFCD